MKLIFDIETAGYDFENLAPSQQEFIMRYAEKESDPKIREQAISDQKRYLSLYPFTSEIVSIGMLNISSGNTMVLYRGDEEWESEDGRIKYSGGSEEQILNKFWEYISKVAGIISFNGKHFDAPFLVMRSAMLKIKPSVNIAAAKYRSKNHIDLQDELSFYGNIRKFNLDFYCHAFGIKSPKTDEFNGMEVRELFKAGKVKEIAKYNAEDVRATYELYKIWEEFVQG
ncbi:MAG: hypothetical protein SCALA702_35890 [Melioribacteraceae bacterium]|nr:MAG: hypothetical protein SCALA702_35890 [Melioribacteraceae bacterium]